MKRFSAGVVAVVAAAILTVPAGAQKKGDSDALFAAARQKESVEGDLAGAIKQYKAIIASHRSDRAIVATALVRMAECYQKLGDAQSRKIWDQIVREYPDQKEAVATAHARLGVGASNAGLTTRQMWTGTRVDAYGSVSPDGRLLSFTDWDTGDLALHDFTTGQDRHLTNKGSWNDSPDQAFMSSISRDGKQVAYGWFVIDSNVEHVEVRLIDLNGGKPRVLVAAKSGEDIEPLDWSPDGKWLAVQTWKTADSTGEVGLVATADGTFRFLKSAGPERSQFSRMTFSPDGKYLACDLPAGGNPDQREIHLLAVDGGSDTPVLTQPANDRVLGWSPDGRLLFASERTGLTGIWSQAIRDGKPQGIPELIKADVNPSPLGLTRAGALYYSVVSSVPHIYLASVDFDTGKVLSGPTPLSQPHLEWNYLPQWSRDGKYLAYLSRRDANTGNTQLNILAIRSTDTGQVRELHPDMPMLNVGGGSSYPLWSPDGEFLIVNARDRQGRIGIYRIDARSGASTPVILTAPDERRITARALAPDGGTLYLERVDAKSKTAALFARDLRSGQERELVRRPGFFSASLSPDGRLLAVIGPDTSRQFSAIVLTPVDGGAPRELLRTSNSGPESLGPFVAWLPDGKSVIFRKGPASNDALVRAGRLANARETFRIPVEGGTAVKYGADWSVGPPAISPNGRDVAFPMGRHAIEIWAMENFLPKTVGASK